MVQDGKARAPEGLASLDGSDAIAGLDVLNGSEGSEVDRPNDFSARA